MIINALETIPDDAPDLPPLAPLSDARVDELVALVLHALDEGKAEDVITIDLRGKSSIADFLVIASGRSSRQVMALADQIVEAMRPKGFRSPPIEGKEHGDWVLVDAGDVIVHLFRPEVRVYYNLEKMWGAPALPKPDAPEFSTLDE